MDSLDDSYFLTEKVRRMFRDVDGKGANTTRLRLGRRVGGIYRDVVGGTDFGSTFTSGKKSGRLFHEMTSMVILRFYELKSAESVNNVKTYELPDDYIITVRHDRH